MTWRYTWQRTWPDVWAESFQQIWRKLLASDPHAHIFHRPELVQIWAETHGKALGAQPMIGLAADDAGNRVLLLWVIVNRRGRFMRRRVLTPAGQSFFCYQDPLVAGANADAIDWAAFWEAVRCNLGNACDHALLRFVHPRYGQGARTEPCSEDNPILSLSGISDPRELLAHCSCKHRGEVGRRARRLSEKGNVELWLPGGSDVSAALADLEEHCLPAYHAAWSRRPAGDMFERPGVRSFFQRVLADGVPAGWAQYAVLRVAGRSIAWQINLVDRGALYLWITTFHADWGNYAPGKVLLAMLLQHTVLQGFQQVHFLTGGQHHKLEWNPESLELRTIRWHAATLRGQVLSGYDWLARTRRAARR